MYETLKNNGLPVRLTKGSGNQDHDGDIIVDGKPGLMIECKERDKKNVVIPLETIQKAKREAGMKDWAVAFNNNREGDEFVLIDLWFFMDLIERKYGE